MSENQEARRGAFEKWWGEPPKEIIPLQDRTGDDSIDMWAWQAFNAALDLIPGSDAVLRGEAVVVPLETTGEMDEAFNCCMDERCIYAPTYWTAMLAASPYRSKP